MELDWLTLYGVVFGYDKSYDFLSSAAFWNIEAKGVDLGLSKRQSLAIHAYTLGLRSGLSPFRLVNGYLRGQQEPTGFAASFATDLALALKGLPASEGEFYRRLTVPEPARRSLVADMVFADKAFLSASIDPDVFSGQDIMLIHASSARQIQVLSAFPHELEVIFLPGTEFMVRRIEEVGSGLVIELSEIEYS